MDKKIEQIKERLNSCAQNGDIELAHIIANGCLCDLLIYLGHKDVVDIYNSFDKWYA